MLQFEGCPFVCGGGVAGAVDGGGGSGRIGEGRGDLRRAVERNEMGDTQSQTRKGLYATFRTLSIT